MIRLFTRSEPGGHAENEDSFAVHPLADETSYLCVVTDGQGGRAGGAVAAREACRFCIEAASTYTIENLLFAETWIRILQGVDEALANNPAAGFTTIYLHQVGPDQVGFLDFCERDLLPRFRSSSLRVADRPAAGLGVGPQGGSDQRDIHNP